MSVKSYLVFPMPGRIEEMLNSLKQLPYSEVVTSNEGDMAILLTETDDALQDKALERNLSDIPSIACLSLVFGHNEQWV